MTLHVCKRLISEALRGHSQLRESHVSCRLFLVFYSSSIEKPTEKTHSVFDLLRKHKISSQIATKVASDLSYLKDTEKCDSVLSFLKEIGFSIAQIEKLVNFWPVVLAASIDKTIKPKIKIFQDLGFSSSDIADIVSADPWILFRSAVNGIKPSVTVLRELLGSNTEVARLLKISGSFLKCNLERTMLPDIEILGSCGISTQRIVRYIYSFPRFFLNKPENMKKFIEKVDSLGCDRNSKMYLHAIRTVASMSEDNWKLKVQHFREYGFSEEEIVSMFRRRPQVFAISNRKIKSVIKWVLDSGKYELSYIFDHPDILICSVEKRLKPRLQVIDILESRNLLKKRPSLSTIYKYSNQLFFRRFVSPYLDKVSELATEGTWTKEIHNLDDMGPGKLRENVVL